MSATRSRHWISPEAGWYDPVATFRAATGDDPLEWQDPYLRETRFAVVLKGRQVGASTAGANIACRYARFWPGFLAAVVSPSQKQSTEVKLRAKNGLERIGERLVQDSATTVGLENGSRIISLPGSPKSVRGWSADLLIIDEAAFLEPETFLAVRATVAATGGRLIVQSTPAAPFGHFYDLWDSSVPVEESYLPGTSIMDPTVSWVRYHVSSEEVPTISDEFLAGERERLNASDYATEYLGDFAAPGLGLVDPAKLRAATAEATQTPREDPSSPWARIASTLGEDDR